MKFPILARRISAAFSIAFSLFFVAPVVAQAATVKFSGNVGYSYGGNSALLSADQVRNFDTTGSSSTLKMELWAYALPYDGTPQTGYKMAEYTLGPLAANMAFTNIYSGQIPFTYPPNGSWNVAMILTEFTGATPDNAGYTPRDWGNFNERLVVGSAPPAVAPYVGSWWNPNESGTGYSIDYRHGMLVVTTYSFAQNGTATWYISAGQLSGNTFTATLDKSVNGQCISCTYRPITPNGNDGTITIVFSSATSATVFLPGGRSTHIVPLEF
jgi:hypothetical protein